jgi:hypothetical protein
MVDLLSDPNFPARAMRTASRALKISFAQDLYKQYSRLQFSRPQDRPFGIAGIEKRLQRAFECEGNWGIFDDGRKPQGGLFHRSLLWVRGEEEGDKSELSPIYFGRNDQVPPSWSWMAYEGGIDYCDPPYNSVEWERTEITPPWTLGGKPRLGSPVMGGSIEMSAIVRKFSASSNGVVN